MPTIQLSSLRQLDIFNPIRAKIHHLLSFSNLEPRWFKYHISFRDIGTKHNPSILCHHFNLLNLRYHWGSLSIKKPTIQLSSLRQLDIFNPIGAKFHHLLSFSNLEPQCFKYHMTFRDIGTKLNPSILCHQLNLSNLRYHSGSLSN